MIFNAQGHLNSRWCLVIDREACAAFWKQTQRGGLLRIYLCKSFNSLYLLAWLWWNILVANFVTNLQDLVAKVKNLVALAPVLGAISRPAKACKHLQWEFLEWQEVMHISCVHNMLGPHALRQSRCIIRIFKIFFDLKITENSLHLLHLQFFKIILQVHGCDI